MRTLVIFTDLDGTLLDEKYSFDAALPALQMIKENDTPLVICSSKTRAEIEYYRRKLENGHPFISENGGGIFIPKKYFDLVVYDLLLLINEEPNYHVIRLGAKYADLRNAIEELREEGCEVKGFGDITVEEISELTGLGIDEATMAKQRDFDEPFLFHGDKRKLIKLFNAIKTKGFNVTQGKFHHILGNSDKGKAVSILISIFRKHSGDVFSIALGDSLNDLPMLRSVDMPIIVRKQNGTYDPSLITLPNLIRADGIGPEGWNKAVLDFLQTGVKKSPFFN